MTPNDAIKLTIDMANEILTTYLSDLDDADLMVRSVPGANHIAWQLGHLVSSEQSMLTGAGFSMPDLPDGFAASYTKETSTSDDATKFHKKDEYLTLMAEQRTATLAALEAISATDLDKPSPESMREYAPTIGALFNIVGVHVMMHAPQFVPVRRKLGKPVLI